MIGAEPRPTPAAKPEPNPDLPEKGAIHEAVKGGDVAGVKKCVASGSSVDQKDKLSRTSLHIAAWQGSAPMVEALLALGYVVLGAASSGAGARVYAVCVCVMCVCVPCCVVPCSVVPYCEVLSLREGEGLVGGGCMLYAVTHIGGETERPGTLRVWQPFEGVAVGRVAYL